MNDVEISINFDPGCGKMVLSYRGPMGANLVSIMGMDEMAKKIPEHIAQIMNDASSRYLEAIEKLGKLQE